jgi:hypothetical protein
MKTLNVIGRRGGRAGHVNPPLYPSAKIDHEHRVTAARCYCTVYGVRVRVRVWVIV